MISLLEKKNRRVRVVKSLAFLTSGHEFPGSLEENSGHYCSALGYIEPFINILPSSRYDLNNVERNVKHQIIIKSPLKCHINFA